MLCGCLWVRAQGENGWGCGLKEVLSQRLRTGWPARDGVTVLCTGNLALAP